MLLDIARAGHSSPAVYTCVLGAFYGEMRGGVPDGGSFVAELDCDDVFRIRENLTLLPEPEVARLEIAGGRTKVIGQFAGFYENRTALFRIGTERWIIDCEGRIDEGQWAELDLRAFEIHPVAL